MKKVITLILIMVLVMLSLVSTNAYSPLGPQDYAYVYFKDYYNSVAGSESTFKNTAIHDFYYSNEGDHNLYVAIRYTSNNPIEEPYFHRFGENNEYYECSDVTNLLFESGITVFCGKYLSFPENHNEDFYTLEEILAIQPLAFNDIAEYLGSEFVGKIGDVDGDGEITIMDTTGIQMHLAKVSLLNNEKIADVDCDGQISVLDATAIQLKLAKID